jgi:hypothetical protein
MDQWISFPFYQKLGCAHQSYGSVSFREVGSKKLPYANRALNG